MAHSIWCDVCERFLWILQGEVGDLPAGKPRRGHVLPTCKQKAANTFSIATRAARNYFSDGVDRVIGLAVDLENRVTRVAGGDAEAKVTIKYEVQHDGDYDTSTLGKTSWRLGKCLTKLWGMQTAIQKEEFEAAFTDVVPCDDLISEDEGTDPSDLPTE